MDHQWTVEFQPAWFHLVNAADAKGAPPVISDTTYRWIVDTDGYRTRFPIAQVERSLERASGEPDAVMLAELHELYAWMLRLDRTYGRFVFVPARGASR